MTRVHRWLCASGRWKATVERHILPWVLSGVDLGAQVLEVGPGPGVTTGLLAARVGRLTSVEIDAALAGALARRTAGRTGAVVCADATTMPFRASTFDAAVSVMMLHHVPSAALQDRLLAEVARVLRPGGVFVGADSVSSALFRLLHTFDTMVVVDPRGLSARLEAAGLTAIEIDVKPHAFRFRARRADRR